MVEVNIDGREDGFFDLYCFYGSSNLEALKHLNAA